MKAIIKMYSPDGEVVPVPVYSEGHARYLRAVGWKPAESYADAKKRNFPVLPTVRSAGSVRFFGR